MEVPEYPFELRRLSEEEGGGWLITFPDLPGCMSDGETVEEAVEHGADAVRGWIATAREFGDPIPEPGKPPSGRFNLRTPKTLHAKLIARAQAEGVSLNTLVISLIAEGMGRRSAA